MKITHIATCYPDHLTDHHNREGEYLYSQPVDAQSTWSAVIVAMKFDLERDDGLPAHLGDDDIARAIDVFSATVDLESRIDPNAPAFMDDDYQAWFLITY